MLVLSRKSGERLVLTVGHHRATIEVLSASNRRVRIGVDAPPDVRVIREELSHRPARKRRVREVA